MSTNHQMNYYDYGKTLDIQGVIPVIGGGVSHNTHEYVDLGLPSKTLWAKNNIQDADGNELYFAWGETQGYTSGQVGTDKYFALSGDNADYKFGTYDSGDTNYGMTKYNNTDRKVELDAEDDAATANWGSNWKMPTKEQFDELISSANTTTAWTQVDGVYGVLFTSTANTNTLFFPAVGVAYDGNVNGVGDVGACFSVSLDGDNVSRAFDFESLRMISLIGRSSRCDGHSVRPVRSNN